MRKREKITDKPHSHSGLRLYSKYVRRINREKARDERREIKFVEKIDQRISKSIAFREMTTVQAVAWLRDIGKHPSPRGAKILIAVMKRKELPAIVRVTCSNILLRWSLGDTSSVMNSGRKKFGKGL